MDHLTGVSLFSVFPYSTLLFAFIYIISTWYIVRRLRIFLFAVFLFISSHFLPFGFYLFVGAQDFWAMGLIFILYSETIVLKWTLEHYLYHGLGDGAT